MSTDYLNTNGPNNNNENDDDDDDDNWWASCRSLAETRENPSHVIDGKFNTKTTKWKQS